MVPAPLHSLRSSSRIVTLLSVLSQHVPNITRILGSSNDNDPTILHAYVKRATANPRSTEFIVFACLIPVLVLLSGVFAGLTLGYMSLDETQLNVLSISGTPQQKSYAAKIKPIRKNGHLLLVTLLLANMIVNETLPIISDPVLGGGLPSVVVSTVLIVIFAEIIPQSLCSRHGLYLGAKMAGFTRVLIYLMGVVAWPVAKLLEFVLGPHHGIIYRRAELKELIAMHSSVSARGGDLNTDTVNIIGATLDLQEKVVKQAMTPIKNVFMLSIDSNLDYDTIKKICLTGHSRVPVYEEVDVVVDPSGRMEKVQKIIGILLVKHCVMLDPKDAIPLRNIPLNKVPFVPNNESLLGILDRFQEGRSHMAIVSRFSVEKAASVKKVAKRSLTQRLRQTVGISDSSDSSESSDEDDFNLGQQESANGRKEPKGISWADESMAESRTIKGNATTMSDAEDGREESMIVKNNTKRKRHRQRRQHRKSDLETGESTLAKAQEGTMEKQNMRLPRSDTVLEQNMPADALLTKKDAKDFLQGIDPAIMPLGIITLEDVLEELIGEEIYDEFDVEGANETKSSFVPSDHAGSGKAETYPGITISPRMSDDSTMIFRPLSALGLGFLRSKSAPPSPLNRSKALPGASATSGHALQPSTLVRACDATQTAPSTPTTIGRAITDEPTPMGETLEESHAAASHHRSVPLKKRAFSSCDTNSLFVNTVKPVALQSASPVPSFEGILLERKRRLAATVVAGKDASSMTTPSLSGMSEDRDARILRPVIISSKPAKMFKSSPLGGGQQTGVIIAENPKREIQDQAEDIRIPGEMDKAGPDKADDSGY